MVDERALDMAVRRFPVLLSVMRNAAGVTADWLVKRYMAQIVAEYRHVVGKET